MQTFLTEGDVFEIKEGMRFYADIPKKFLYHNCRMSDEMTMTDITAGGVFVNRLDLEETKQKIIKGINEQFNRELGIQMDTKEIENFVTPLISSHTEEQFDTDVFIGEYVVTKAFYEGSSTYKVFARQLKEGKFNPEGKEICFYQKGTYSVNIDPEEVTLLRKLQMTFV